MIWVGSDKSNRTYIVRTIVHFVILITGCTLLMIWFGWLPPSEWIVWYYAGFIAFYIIIWLVCWNMNRKKWKAMNEKLQEFAKEKTGNDILESIRIIKAAAPPFFYGESKRLVKRPAI